jgi:hypothetical protein
VAQRRKTHKLRATAVVEVTTDSTGKVTTRVVPVTVLDEGQFQDASIYKATPRPMALENGIVYEAQTSGIPVANTTILSGANSNGWTALGRWQVVTAAPKKSDTPPPVVTTNDRPTLHHRAESGSTDSSASAPSGSSGSSPSSSSDDRPTLHRPTDSSPSASGTPSPSATPTPSPSSTSPSSTSDDRPTLHRPTESAPSASPSPTPSAASQTTTSQSPADNSQSNNAPSAQAEDPDRPTLRRRNSAEQGSPAPQSPQSKPTQVETSSPATKTSATAPGTTAPGITKTFVAVSDTTPTDVRSFDFQWKPGEAEPMELKMRKLALAQIPKEHTQVQVTKEETQLTPKSLKNVVIRSFDLDLSNDAVIVLSAEIPATVPSTKESSAKFISRYVTVIARVDFDGEPQKILASVTDSSRLDVTPRLELIDAVDVDGDGIAELLFRQYGYDEKSFVVYSVGHSTATKLFEGASRSLRSAN